MLLNCGVGEDSWESLGLQEIKPVNPKGNRSWIFTGRTDAEAETPILWPSDVKSWLIGKDPDAGKDWRWEEKGMTEDEMVGWHHWLDGHEFEQTPGVGDGQGSLVCCSPWGRKELDMTEWLNWTEIVLHICLLNCISSVWFFEILWTVAHQAPLFMRFSRQEYWSGLPFRSAGYLPDSRTEPSSFIFPALTGRFFTTGTKVAQGVKNLAAM